MTQLSENRQLNLFEENRCRIELLPAAKLRLQAALEALLLEIAIDLARNGDLAKSEDLAKKEIGDDQDHG
jgi:hypothetical protein